MTFLFATMSHPDHHLIAPKGTGCEAEHWSPSITAGVGPRMGLLYHPLITRMMSHEYGALVQYLLVREN
jgi:hypothetical protein